MIEIALPDMKLIYRREIVFVKERWSFKNKKKHLPFVAQ